MPIAEIDFETYSEAGLVFDESSRKWGSLPNALKRSIKAVGAPVYAAHPSTEVLCLAYNLHNGNGPQIWIPGVSPGPQDLFDYLEAGGLVEAWNSAFEWYIWNWVCVPKLGWPPLPYTQLRDAMAKSLAYSMPAALENAGVVAGTKSQKLKEGTRLIRKFCIPRNPTKNDARTRILPADDPEDAQKLYVYCLGDIAAEHEISEWLPELIPIEEQVWLLDQAINFRGIPVDMESIDACIGIVLEAFAKYTAELPILTNGVVQKVGQAKVICEWLLTQNVSTSSIDKDHVADLLKRTDLPPNARRVLEIRKILSSASVKKLFALKNRASIDHRLRDQIRYCGADRTGRFSSMGVQFQNLTNSGPKVNLCRCGKRYGAHTTQCPWCFSVGTATVEDWGLAAVEDVLEIAQYKSLDIMERFFGDAIPTISGCLRGLIYAAPGKEFICSDFSSIEAIATAVIAGETWRIDVFKTHGQIYEMSASTITGVPFEEFAKFREANNGAHHPMRKLGKLAELASGYGGSVPAWKHFKADKYFDSDEDILAAVKAWRSDSPAIVALWYGLQEAAISAVENPGKCFSYRGVSYGVKGDVLRCLLPSGRMLSYHQPRLKPDSRIMLDAGGSLSTQEALTDRYNFESIHQIEGLCIRAIKYGDPVFDYCFTVEYVDRRLFIWDTNHSDPLCFNDPYVWKQWKLSYMGWNSNSQVAPIGWIEMDTWGGKLTENYIQALCRDILVFVMLNLERAGYPIVMHVHDEPVSEVSEGHGSIEEYERIMATPPSYAADWPIGASGGWRGKRYRKD